MFSINVYTWFPLDYESFLTMKEYVFNHDLSLLYRTAYDNKELHGTISVDDCDIQDIRNVLQLKFGHPLRLFIMKTDDISEDNEKLPSCIHVKDESCDLSSIQNLLTDDTNTLNRLSIIAMYT